MELVTKDDVKIFKGKYYLPYVKYQTTKTLSSSKIVVFDLDETLGSFADLYIIWRGVKHIWVDCCNFYDLVDIFPEFLRYGVLTILKYLYDKKKKRQVQQVILYTNNQCQGDWLKELISYFEFKLNTQTRKLFDKVIGPYKINSTQVEKNRTSHKKTIKDLNQYLLPNNKNGHICFIDDVLFNEMKTNNVYYICPRPYAHTLSRNTIFKRLINIKWLPSKLQSLNTSSFWKLWFSIHHYKTKRPLDNQMAIDLQISKKILMHLKDFVEYKTNVNHNYTKKFQKRKTNKKTKKIR